ncbi:MAG: aminotransferase class I/II-fold pyridoxal phosphate-dependent enzyme [Clostridia bacterium]|nr:aminotransferase class I/II-fold pyridoxal phosphate-dependent enzyme [Clostridia bacterium]
MENSFRLLNIDSQIEELSEKTEEKYKEDFEKISEIELYNQAKVLKAFKDAEISQVHFSKTTGYGYDDIGREAIEKIYAQIFHTEDSLVRIQFVNGTHTIATALEAMLLPGDKLLAITGKPYDTLCEVIGLIENKLSLKSYGVLYDQIELKEDGGFDFPKIKEYIENNKVKLIHIQRSKGYALRKALLIEDIEKVVQLIKSIDKNIIIMVDNCYGEFVEKREPTDVGADIACGSLIKNIGGGLCETGGYIVGRKDLIELCSQKLTCPGIGKECGATLGQNRYILQGLFNAPAVVKSALHAAILASGMMAELGFEVYPRADEKRGDIVQAIKLGDKEKLIKFIQGIQYASPVDSHVTPYPWNMPGYTDQVIMAAGTFVEGASIELSADSPIREPYVAYMQGGITYESAKLAICQAIQNMIGE